MRELLTGVRSCITQAKCSIDSLPDTAWANEIKDLIQEADTLALLAWNKLDTDISLLEVYANQLSLLTVNHIMDLPLKTCGDLIVIMIALDKVGVYANSR